MTPQEVRELREEMDGAIRAYADALWELQDGESDNVLGDMVVIAHFTPLDRLARDNVGDTIPSPQYILLTPRDLAPHALHGLMIKGGDLAQEDEMITMDMMYPEDLDDEG